LRMSLMRGLTLVLLLWSTAQTGFAQENIPIRDLAPVSATSADRFGGVLGVRELSDGRLLVNDGRKRQLLLLDASLRNRTVVLDSVSGNGRAYGPRATPLIPYLGDSTFIVDGASRTMVLLGPSGEIARVASAPKPNDLNGLAYATSGIDASGNLLYLVRERLKENPMLGFRRDSAAIVRANFDTRAVDTLGRVKLPGGVVETDTLINERLVITRVINPLTTIDEWAVLSNGTVAFVRGGDYHVDLLHSDGKSFKGPKLPFDWTRLTEKDKQALIDSARAAYEAEEKDTSAPPTYVSAAAVAAAANGGPRLSKSTAPRIVQLPAPINEIGEYWPSIRQGAVKSDQDSNLWILPTTTAQSNRGELVYDVVNLRGELFERARVPSGKSIAGFGKNGIVYLMYRDGDAGWVLERARVNRSRAVP
jgi:hypothetical protein